MPQLNFKIVPVKQWDIHIEDSDGGSKKIKSIRLSVWDRDEHLGDLLVERKGVTWIPIKNVTLHKKQFKEWSKFISLMESHGKKKAAAGK
jgi:hypothetical protein